MSETRREAFSIGNGPSAYNDPVYADKWLGIRNEKDASSVVRLTGGYKTTEHPGYKAFPEGQGQGELFNWQHPEIKGLYRGDDSSKMDLGAVLGMAVAESKRRWGVEPIEDEQLSEESAELTKKLTGRDKPVNYHTNYDKEDSREYGNTMARLVDSKAQSNGGQVLPASDIEEGSKTIRTKVSEMRRAKRKANNKSSKNTMSQESRVAPFKQEVLPLEWN